MAVDSRSKRASIIGLACAARLVLPLPDAAIDQVDRQHVAICYSGILASAPVAPGVADHETVIATYVASEDLTGTYVVSEDVTATIED